MKGSQGLDPYSSFKISTDVAFADRGSIAGRVVAVMDLVLPERSLNLITPHSRALRKYEIHELILTADPSARPGGTARGAAYLCFFEVTRGGVILVNDRVVVNNAPVCTIRGYDETHAPNHINIVCYDNNVKTGKQLGLRVGDKVVVTRSQ
ncbi:MAG: hypothetical protein QW705_04755 [Zestosphaera sp.]